MPNATFTPLPTGTRVQHRGSPAWVGHVRECTRLADGPEQTEYVIDWMGGADVVLERSRAGHRSLRDISGPEHDHA